MIKLEEYRRNDIYDAIETGISGNELPWKSLAFRELSAPVHKVSKVGIIAMYCANVSEYHALSSLVIGKSTKSRCCKNIT